VAVVVMIMMMVVMTSTMASVVVIMMVVMTSTVASVVVVVTVVTVSVSVHQESTILIIFKVDKERRDCTSNTFDFIEEYQLI